MNKVVKKIIKRFQDVAGVKEIKKRNGSGTFAPTEVTVLVDEGATSHDLEVIQYLTRKLKDKYEDDGFYVTWTAQASRMVDGKVVWSKVVSDTWKAPLL